MKNPIILYTFINIDILKKGQKGKRAKQKKAVLRLHTKIYFKFFLLPTLKKGFFCFTLLPFYPFFLYIIFLYKSNNKNTIM